jgi:hypothetical protein
LLQVIHCQDYGGSGKLKSQGPSSVDRDCIAISPVSGVDMLRFLIETHD